MIVTIGSQNKDHQVFWERPWCFQLKPGEQHIVTFQFDEARRIHHVVLDGACAIVAMRVGNRDILEDCEPLEAGGLPVLFSLAAIVSADALERLIVRPGDVVRIDLVASMFQGGA